MFRKFNLLAVVVCVLLPLAGWAVTIAEHDTEIYNNNQAVDLLGYSDYHVVTMTTLNLNTYLNTMENYDINLQRVWITGYSRSGEGDWLSGELMPWGIHHYNGNTPIYDLETFSETYFSRLESFLDGCDDRGMVALLDPFDHWAMYAHERFIMTPWYTANNVNGVMTQWTAFDTFYRILPGQGNDYLGDLQEMYVKEVVSRTKHHRNIIWEIMNEPRDGSDADVGNWHWEVAKWIKDVDPGAVIGACPLASQEYTVLNCPDITVGTVHYDWNGNISWTISHLANTYDVETIIDDDGAWMPGLRDDNDNVESWAWQAVNNGGHFNHKDEIEPGDIDYDALTRLRNQSPSNLDWQPAPTITRMRPNNITDAFNGYLVFTGQWFAEDARVFLAGTPIDSITTVYDANKIVVDLTCGIVGASGNYDMYVRNPGVGNSNHVTLSVSGGGETEALHPMVNPAPYKDSQHNELTLVGHGSGTVNCDWYCSISAGGATLWLDSSLTLVENQTPILPNYPMVDFELDAYHILLPVLSVQYTWRCVLTTPGGSPAPGSPNIIHESSVSFTQ